MTSSDGSIKVWILSRGNDRLIKISRNLVDCFSSADRNYRQYLRSSDKIEEDLEWVFDSEHDNFSAQGEIEYRIISAWV